MQKMQNYTKFKTLKKDLAKDVIKNADFMNDDKPIIEKPVIEVDLEEENNTFDKLLLLLIEKKVITSKEVENLYNE